MSLGSGAGWALVTVFSLPAGEKLAMLRRLIRRVAHRPGEVGPCS